MSKYTKLFNELMELMEIRIDKEDDSYVIYDLQTKDYRTDSVNNASDIFDNLECFINDYIVKALEEIEQDEMGMNYEYKDWKDYYEYLTKNMNSNYAWYVDVLGMVCLHANKINLKEITVR